MFRTGLVSITFRKLSPEEIVKLVSQAGLQEIEWGGDVHVPHGDVQRAEKVRRLTESAGLRTAAYGSYYRLGAEPGKSPVFADVLASATALGAPTIRVWPGTRASAEADAAYRTQVAEELHTIADEAARANIGISLEFHANTLTDTTDSAVALLDAVPHTNVRTLWQPPNGAPLEYCVEGLRQVLPRSGNIHVFHWWPTAGDRHPLTDGTERWREYLEILRATGKERALLLEFVRGDDPAQFLEDATTLKAWALG